MKLQKHLWYYKIGGILFLAPPPSHHVCDIRNETCFRCVWSRRASTTTPSSRKWERTHPPSRCSSRNWARSNTHTHGRITSISAAVTSLTCLSSQTPGPSDGPQTRESGSRLECGCALQKRRPRCFFFFFSPSTPFCFILFLCYSPDFLYGLFLSLPQTRTLVVSGITAIATSGNLVG